MRDDCEIAIVTSFGTPIPPSPETSQALLAAFEERGIAFHPGRRIRSLGPETVALDDGTELPFAVGDVATAGVPKAGVFSEAAARVVAESVLAAVRGGEPPAPFDGRASCYIEFGSGRVGRVDIDFLSGPTRTGSYHAPSAALVEEKRHFGASRRARWFDAGERAL